MPERPACAINAPIAVIAHLMTSASDGVLGAQRQGARLQRPPAQPEPSVKAHPFYAKVSAREQINK